jgi:hypothetical protein
VKRKSNPSFLFTRRKKNSPRKKFPREKKREKKKMGEKDEDRALVHFSTLDTSKFSDLLIKNIIYHPDFSEQERGMVKLWLSVRKVWHDDDIMPAFLMQGTLVNENTTFVDGTHYLASVLRNQPQAGKMYEIDKDGNVTIDRTSFFVFCLSIGVQLSTLNLLRQEEAKEIQVMALNLKIINKIDKIKPLMDAGLNVVVTGLLD